MSQLYNQKSQTRKRQALRSNMPQSELVLWTQLKSKQVHNIKFRRQYSIGPYVVDFYSAKIRLAIELDGDSHFTDGAPQYDHERQKYIEECGIKFIRFTNLDIQQNLAGVMEKIEETVSNLRSTPSNSPSLEGEREVH